MMSSTMADSSAPNYVAMTTANINVGGINTPVVVGVTQAISGGYDWIGIDITAVNSASGTSLYTLAPTSGANAYEIYSNAGYGGFRAGTIIKGVVIDPHSSTSGDPGYIYVLFTETGNTHEDTGFGIAVFREYVSSGSVTVSHVSGDDVYELGNQNDPKLYKYWYQYNTGNPAPCCGYYTGYGSFVENPCGMAIDTTRSKVIITGSEEIYTKMGHEGIGTDACSYEYTEGAGGALSGPVSQIVWGSSVTGVGSGAIGPVAVDPYTGDVFGVWSDGTTIVEGSDHGTYGFIPIYDGIDGNRGILEDTGGAGVAWYSNVSDIAQIGVTDTEYAGWYSGGIYNPLIVVLDSSNGLTLNNNVDDFYFTTSFSPGVSITQPTNNGWAQNSLYVDPDTGDFATVGSFYAQIWYWDNNATTLIYPTENGFTTDSSSNYNFGEPYGGGELLIVLAPDTNSALHYGQVDIAVSGGSTYPLWGEF